MENPVWIRKALNWFLPYHVLSLSHCVLPYLHDKGDGDAATAVMNCSRMGTGLARRLLLVAVAAETVPLSPWPSRCRSRGNSVWRGRPQRPSCQHSRARKHAPRWPPWEPWLLSQAWVWVWLHELRCTWDTRWCCTSSFIGHRISGHRWKDYWWPTKLQSNESWCVCFFFCWSCIYRRDEKMAWSGRGGGVSAE